MRFFRRNLLVILASLSLLCCFSADCADAVRQGLDLCCRSAVPALLPFFCVSSAAVECGLAQQLGHFAAPLMRRVFHLPGVGASALALGFLGGYPAGARTSGELYQQGACTRKEAETLAVLCNNTGPAFLVGMCGGLFGSVRWGFFLYGIHIAAALLVGLLLRPRQLPSEETPSLPDEKPMSLCLTQSVLRAGLSCAQVSAFLIFFSVLLRLARVTGLLPLLTQGLCLLPLGLTPDSAEPLLSGMCELTQGICALGAATGDLPCRLTIASFLCAFGGVSVWFQSVSAANVLSLRRCALGKTLHALCAAALCRTVLWAGDWLRTPAAPEPFAASLCLMITCCGIFALSRLVFAKNHWKRTGK